MNAFIDILGSICLFSVFYLSIGWLLGNKSLKVWKEGKNEGLWPLFLFPCSYLGLSVGSDRSGLLVASMCKHPQDERVYLQISAAIWPLRIAFFLAVTALFFILAAMIVGMALIILCFEMTDEWLEKKGFGIMHNA